MKIEIDWRVLYQGFVFGCFTIKHYQAKKSPSEGGIEIICRRFEDSTLETGNEISLIYNQIRSTSPLCVEVYYHEV